MGIDDPHLASALRPLTTPMGQEADAPPYRRVFLVVLDETQESHAAIHYACKRVKKAGGRVALLAVAPPPEYQHWMFVGNLMQEEAHEKAQERLQSYAAMVHTCSGEMPELFLREGDTMKELLALLNEDDGISVLVLAAAPGPKGPGPLVKAVTGKFASKLRVPVTILPGDLTEDDIDRLT